MIKDKINLELKSRFLQEIRKTEETGNERGFLICIDEKDRLYATKSCEGKECSVNLSSLKSQCNFKTQGEFHTHPFTADAVQYTEEKLGKRVSIEEAKNFVKDIAKKKNISLTEPSYKDLLGTIISKYTNRTLGTTCVSADIEPGKVECWSTKNKITENDFDMAFIELTNPDVNKSPLKWARDLFGKEIIDLK
jgi:hypothetical protein